MDPDAALKQLFQHLADEEYEEALQTLYNLDTWMLTGGYYPRAFKDQTSWLFFCSSICKFLEPLVDE